MAKGHTIPLMDLTHLLRHQQQATVTFLATPGNAAFVHAVLAGADGMAIVELPFTDNLTDSGAPPHAEYVEALDSLSSLSAFVESVSQLRPRFEELTLADIPFSFNDPATTGPIREIDAKVGYAIANSHALIVNTFDAMEGHYIQHWNRHVSSRA
ncbi:UDP-glycosyltransferase 90A1-like [Miscanthus floridulus]|uniref:UDP-glycosyltransferase 90A1-like n=1 Tax=Miscanthus floridulus TaxID=154761 RepID=UPI003459AF02